MAAPDEKYGTRNISYAVVVAQRVVVLVLFVVIFFFECAVGQCLVHRFCLTHESFVQSVPYGVTNVHATKKTSQLLFCFFYFYFFVVFCTSYHHHCCMV